ncbi:MAG: thioredoxin family protein [Chloroflexi bacterium]|nr:thioredoxin family protein [Chloroflexota bacterium]
MILERLLLTLILAATAVALCTALRWWQGRRVQAAVSVAADRPTLLYFRADSCPSCPTQGRFVAEAIAQLGHNPPSVHLVDAEQERETAARYAVFSLPTTIVLDGRGIVRHINNGLTYPHQLVRQLQGAVE